MVASTAACDASLPSVARRILSNRFAVFMTGASHPRCRLPRVEWPRRKGAPGPLQAGPKRLSRVCVRHWGRFASVSSAQDRKDALLEAGLTLASELSLPIV